MPRPRPAFEIQGHRGARGLFPENTLEGFERAIGLGVDALELDVGLTRDGIPVVFHDLTLSPDIVRKADGAWVSPGLAIRDLTRAELALYDVGRLRPGSDYARRYPEQTAIDGAVIPDLEAVLRLAQGHAVRVDIELKTRPDRPDLAASPIEMAECVMALVDRLGVSDGIDVRAFDWRPLVHLRRTRPEAPLTWLTNVATERDPALWWGATTGTDPIAAILAVAGERDGLGCWAPEGSGLTRERIVRAHAAGLRVIPWTINEPTEMARLIAWGVDGICTDRPDIARQIRGKSGRGSGH